MRRRDRAPKAAEDDGSAAGGRRRWTLLAITGVLSAGIVVAAFNPAPHTGGDNAGYVALAYSLLSDGSYTEVFDPAAPPHTKYPPVFPAVLALLMLLGARSWVALKSVAALSTVATAMLTYLWAERRIGPGWAFGVAVVVSSASAMVYYSHWVLSDPTFVALTVLALWALDRGDSGEPADRWVVLGVAAAGLAYFTRSAGLPLLTALGVWLVLRRRWRWVAATAAGLGVPVVLWLLRARSAGQGSYVSEFWLVDPYDPGLGRVGAAGLAGRMFGNLIGYVGTHVPGGIVGSGGAPVAVLGVALVAVGGAGWLRVARRKLGPAEIFLPMYAGLLLVWPEVWSGDRFALPLYPPLLVYGALLLREIAGTGGARAALFGGAALAVLVIPALGAWTAMVGQARECGARIAVQGPFACYGTRVDAFVGAAGWAGANLPDGAAVLSRKPRIFYVMSGVPSRTFPFDESAAAHLAAADATGARYELLDEWDGLASRYVVPAVRQDPGAFCGLRGFGESGRTQLLGVLPPGARRPTADAAGSTVRLVECPPGYVEGEGTSSYSSSSRIPLLDRLDP